MKLVQAISTKQICTNLFVCVCVCVCVWEREREGWRQIDLYLFNVLGWLIVIYDTGPSPLRGTCCESLSNFVCQCVDYRSSCDFTDNVLGNSLSAFVMMWIHPRYSRRMTSNHGTLHVKRDLDKEHVKNEVSNENEGRCHQGFLWPLNLLETSGKQ